MHDSVQDRLDSEVDRLDSENDRLDGEENSRTVRRTGLTVSIIE